MQDLNDFVWFVKVVEHGGFAAAGRALDQPKSKLSRRIAQLEEHGGSVDTTYHAAVCGDGGGADILSAL